LQISPALHSPIS